MLDEAKIFGMAPLFLKEVDEVNGIPLYSSEKLQNKLKIAISSFSVLNPVRNKISELIDEGRIVPCYANKNLFRLYRYKKAADEERSTIAFYSAEHNKIFLPLDERNIRYFWVDDSLFGEVLLHEMQHYCSRNLKQPFYNIFKGVMNDFYREFYRSHLNIRMNDTELSLISSTLFSLNDYSKEFDTKSLVKFAHVLNKILKNYIKDDKKREDTIVKMLSVVKVYLLNLNYFISQLTSFNTEARKIYNSLRDAYYYSLNIKNIDSLFIQELYFPSEIICIQAQYATDARHYKVINMV